MPKNFWEGTALGEAAKKFGKQRSPEEMADEVFAMAEAMTNKNEEFVGKSAIEAHNLAGMLEDAFTAADYMFSAASNGRVYSPRTERMFKASIVKKLLPNIDWGKFEEMAVDYSKKAYMMSKAYITEQLKKKFQGDIGSLHTVTGTFLYAPCKHIEFYGPIEESIDNVDGYVIKFIGASSYAWVEKGVIENCEDMKAAE